MAKNKKISSTFMRTLIGDKNEQKIGNYMESTGGGTPLKKGEKLKDHPEAKRVQQPRDEDGKFTYNAVNRKPLKYGPSRGTTIVPFLKGVKIKYAIKKGDKINYNGMIYLAGMDIGMEEILNLFKEYKEDGGFGVLESGVSKKVGRRSNKEKEAIAKDEQGLIGEHLIKLNGGYILNEVESALQAFDGKIKQTNDTFAKKKNNDSIKKEKNNNMPVNNVQNMDKKVEQGTNMENNKIENNKISEEIKKDPKKFIQDNFKEIKNIMSSIEGLKASDIVNFMSSGKFNSLSELKDFIEKNK